LARPKLINIVVVPESLIREAAELAGGANNSFIELLAVADFYRVANLTPVFISDRNMRNLTVTSQEKLQKLYH
jgi:hypothetical protein